MQVEVKPVAVPSMLIDKDWSKRPCFAFEGLQTLGEALHNFEIREDDIIVETLPKCGTTWMQELVWLISHDFNFNRARSEDIDDRSPSFEVTGMKSVFGITTGGTYQQIDDLESPRVIKSHYSLPLLPKQIWEKKPKIVYVFRDPRDAMVSMYYYSRSLGAFGGETLEDICNMYLEFEIESNATWNHVTEFYHLRHEDWIYYTSYEMMKRNLRGVILDICKFLNKTITEEQMQKMLQHLQFAAMKENEQTSHENETLTIRSVIQGEHENNSFFRKGEVGGYRSSLSPGLVARLDKWVVESLKPYNVTLNELLLLESKSKL